MVFGESVNLPMRVILNNLAAEFRPHSSSAQFTELWKQDHATSELMSKVFDRWRARSLNPEGKSIGSVVNASGRKVPPVPLPPGTPPRHMMPPIRPNAAGARPQAPIHQGSALASQVRERLKAKATASGIKPTSVSDVKSMLNSAFHKSI